MGVGVLPDAKRHEGRRWVCRAIEELQRAAGMVVAYEWPRPEAAGKSPLVLVSGQRREIVTLDDDEILRAGLGLGAARENIRRMLRAALATLRGGEVARRRVASVEALD
jgi:hypothetical protein